MKINMTTKLGFAAAASLALASYAIAGTHNANGVLHSAGHGNSAFGHSHQNLNSGTHGNSAFGHRQGNPATRTRGEQNSRFGRARAAAAHPSPTP
jgi:hypothetical protein